SVGGGGPWKVAGESGAVPAAHGPPDPDVYRERFPLIKREEEDAVRNLSPDSGQAQERGECPLVRGSTQRLQVHLAGGNLACRLQEVAAAVAEGARAKICFAALREGGRRRKAGHRHRSIRALEPVDAAPAARHLSRAALDLGNVIPLRAQEGSHA